MLDIHWVTGIDTGYPYPRKNIRGYLIISLTVSANNEFNHTYIQWIIIRGYLPIPVPIAIPNPRGQRRWRPRRAIDNGAPLGSSDGDAPEGSSDDDLPQDRATAHKIISISIWPCLAQLLLVEKAAYLISW
jgi:hypothetical protein